MRMRDIVYPDGEEVHYGYTTGGLLHNVYGVKHGIQTDYLLNRHYDEQGRKIFQEDGNGAWTEYTYDPQRQWLNRLYTGLPSSDIIQDIKYQYDSVGNITHIDQSAPAFAGGKLGGTYTNDYLYDRQYRLVRSNGSGDFLYMFDASYSPSGRMGHKMTNIKTSGDLFFGYDQLHMTHQPRTMFDRKSGRALSLYWDMNGNLAQVIDCKQNLGRLHEWDEENRLRFVLGEKYAGYYGYNADGERVYKLTGTSNIGQINSGTTKAQAIFDDAVLYPNPYIVVTQKGYTKHYYAGTERLATVIGSGGFDDMTPVIDKLSSQHDQDIVKTFYTHYQNYDPFYYQNTINNNKVLVEDINGKADPNLEYQCKPTELEVVDILSNQDMLLKSILNSGKMAAEENEVFFYHGDHLGSANWITDMHGSPIQYIHYAPYGELIVNQTPHKNYYNERYKFTGKERDTESGYDFFGARFYWGMGGHWLSVDPLSDKYPNISPYAYCAWNPLKYVDPDGNRPLPIDPKYNGWTARVDSWFGPRNTGQKGASTYHRGLDLNYSCGGDGDYGTPILATHEGFAHIVDNIDGKAGRYVEITSEDGTVRTRYLHLSAISINEGQYVLESDKIGEMGGSASGNEHRWLSHLHYEIQKIIDGKWTSIDPVEGKDKNINNILDPQSIIDVDDNLYCGEELKEIVVVNPFEL